MHSEGTSRTDLLKMFLNLDDGKHLNYDFVHQLKVRAFRIVPEGTEGNIMVDGEKVPYGR